MSVQIRDINSGTFGFVELALDKTTGQQVAIKFIDRGEKVTKYVQRYSPVTHNFTALRVVHTPGVSSLLIFLIF